MVLLATARKSSKMMTTKKKKQHSSFQKKIAKGIEIQYHQGVIGKKLCILLQVNH